MPNLGEKALVEFDCKVRRYGPPIPSTDSEGNVGPGRMNNPKVDAFTPAARPFGQAPKIHLKTHYFEGDLSPDELASFINEGALTDMGTSDLFSKRQKRRDQLAKKNIATHKKKMKTVGNVTTADYQPPYENGKERIPTGLVQLDFKLRGGITPGTAIGLWGPKFIGKTTLSHRFEAAIMDYYTQKVYEYMISEGHSEEEAKAAAAEEQGLAIATEGYDSTYASRLGVRPKQVMRPRFRYGEQYLQFIVDNIQSDVEEFADHKEPGIFSYMLPVNARYCKIDSVDSLEWFSDTHGARNKEQVLHDNQKMADRASIMSQFFRVNSAAPSVPVTQIFLTQERMKMAGSATWKSGLRGNAFAHNIRLEIKMSNNKGYPDEGDTSKLTDLEFRQIQMPGGTNLTERETVTLVQRLSGGFFPKDQNVFLAADRGILNKKGGGHWEYNTRSGEEISSKGDSTGVRSGDLADIADAIEEHAGQEVLDEIYDRLMNVLSGRDMDDDGSVAEVKTTEGEKTTYETDEEGERAIAAQEA